MLEYFIRDGDCGTEIAFSIIGSKWASEVIRICFLESNASFSAFKRRLPGISDSSLAAQLKKLNENGMIEKQASPNDGNKSNFTLTQKGLDMILILKTMHHFAIDMGYGSSEPASQIEYTRKLIGNKWKSRIIWILYHCAPIRFNEMQRAIEGISFKVLSQNLTDMEKNGLILRTAYDEKIPHVEYSLTDSGKDAYLIVQSLASWCKTYGLLKAKITIGS